MKKNIFTFTFFSFLAFFAIGGSASASVSCDFGSNFEVTYDNGIPSPSNATCSLVIVNDESGVLSLDSLQIDSTSMAFVGAEGGNAANWSCSYIQLTSAPNFTGRTICTPNGDITLSPGGSTNVDLRFSFENTSDTTQQVPNSVALTSLVANGTVDDLFDVSLGNFDWSIKIVTDGNDKKEGEIEGYVYLDDNYSGKKDENEKGVSGVKIRLRYAGDDGKFHTIDDKIYRDKTNSKGKYHFKDLSDGKYRVKVNEGEMKGFQFISEKGNNNNARSIVQIKGDETKHRDFGYVRNVDLRYLKSGFSFYEFFKSLFGI